MNLLRTALGLCLLLPWTAPAAEDVRVYRCVASNGAVALQDRPCSSGRQEVRDLQRPRDPAPRVVRSDATPAPPDEVPVMRDREVRHVYIQPPQPLYECVSDDGRRYTSDNNEGNPRWVPLWTSVWLPHGHHGPAHPGPRPAFGTPVGTPIGEGTGYRPPAVGVGVQVPAGSVLVRDSCHALPPQEVCAPARPPLGTGPPLQQCAAERAHCHQQRTAWHRRTPVAGLRTLSAAPAVACTLCA